MSDWIDLLAVIVSWTGVLVSYVFAQRSRQDRKRAHAASQEANRIQADMLELARQQEEDRRRKQAEAQWRCWLEPQVNSKVIVIKNVGPAPARRVRVLLNDVPAHQSPNVFGNPVEDVGDLDAGAEVRYGIVDFHASPLVRKVTVSWQDAAGKENRFNTNVQ